MELQCDEFNINVQALVTSEFFSLIVRTEAISLGKPL